MNKGKIQINTGKAKLSLYTSQINQMNTKLRIAGYICEWKENGNHRRKKRPRTIKQLIRWVRNFPKEKKNERAVMCDE